MTDRMHNLIDGGADQPVINERVAGLMDGLARIGTDHEKRIRFLEKTVNYALGAIGLLSAILYLISILKHTA